MPTEVLDFPICDQPKISVIIGMGSSQDNTYECLRSLLYNAPHIPYEVILVGDRKHNEKQKYIRNVRMVQRVSTKQHLSLFNIGAKQAKGKFIVFLPSDALLQPNCIQYLYESITKDEQIGIIGPKLLLPDGKLYAAGGTIWGDGKRLLYGKGDDSKKCKYNYFKEVDYLPAVCLMIRAALWKKSGGFDLNFTSYFVEADLSFKARRLGYKVMYQPKSKLACCHQDTENITIAKDKENRNTSRNAFVKKWNVILQKEHFPKREHLYWARDRSRNKKTIVVVDENGPKIDKQTVARSTFHYMKLFVSMGMNVIFIGDNYWENHSRYCRQEPYTTTLEDLGIQVLYGQWNESNLVSWIKGHSEYIDYVYLCRPHIAIKYIENFREFTNAKVIYNICDLHYIRELRNYEITKDPQALQLSERWKRIEFNLFEKSHVIHVLSSFEKKILKRSFPDKKVRQIPVFIYDQIPEIPPYEKRSDIMFVGQFEHKPNTDGVLWFVHSVLPLLIKNDPSIKFYILGAKLTDTIKQLSTENVIVIGQVTDKELEEFYHKSKLVIAPLRFGAGVKGKVIEAMYYGVPAITTSIGAEGLPDIEKFLPIANDKEQWVRYILDIYYSKDRWQYISAKSRDYVRRFFSKEFACQQVQKDIRFIRNNAP